MDRKNSILAGALFLMTTAAYLTGSGMVEPQLAASNLLTSFYPAKSQVLTGILLEWVNALGVVGIGAFLYPVLRKYDEGAALGYFGSRVIESALLFVSVLGPILLLTLSRDFLATNTDQLHFTTLATFTIGIYHLAFKLAMISLGMGSLLFCAILFKSRIVPRIFPLVGFVGYIFLLAYSVFSILGVKTSDVLFIPGALFELALPIWLIVKGFNAPHHPNL